MSDENDGPPEIGLYDPYTSTMFRNGLPEPVAWSWYSIIQTWGLDHAVDMLMRGIRELSPTNEAQRDYMRRWLRAIKVFGDTAGEKEEHVLKTSYDMLRRGEWEVPRAHRFAQDVLDPTLTETAWRLRLLRYRKKHNRPPWGKRGRPRKQK